MLRRMLMQALVEMARAILRILEEEAKGGALANSSNSGSSELGSRFAATGQNTADDEHGA
jgi:hypothetical protein